MFAFQQVDVFSSKPLLGNPLAVVIGADALSEEQMARFASWTNLSETTFLLEPTPRHADYRVRIFARQREVPFAGHPTLGSCHVWLAAGGVAKGREIVQECGLGLISIRRAAERLSFVAPKLVRSGPIEPEILARVVRGLDLTPDAIMASNWVDNGSGWLAIMLRSREGVLALRFAGFNPLKDGNSAQFEVRAFSVEDVGREDPVTGSLNAGLAQWLIGNRIAPSEYVVSQGTALRRMGRVYIEQNGSQIWVGGMVRTCVVGELTALMDSSPAHRPRQGIAGHPLPPSPDAAGRTLANSANRGAHLLAVLSAELAGAAVHPVRIEVMERNESFRHATAGVALSRGRHEHGNIPIFCGQQDRPDFAHARQ